MVRHFSQVVARTGNENEQSMQTFFSQKAQRPFVSFPTLRIGVTFKAFKKSFSMEWSSHPPGGTCFSLQITHSVHSMTFSQHPQRSSSSVHAALGGTPPGRQMLHSTSMLSSSSSTIAGAGSGPCGAAGKTPAAAAEAARLEGAGFSSKNPFRMARKEVRKS